MDKSGERGSEEKVSWDCRAAGARGLLLLMHGLVGLQSRLGRAWPEENPGRDVAIRAAEELGAVESVFFLGGKRGISFSSIIFLLITGVRGLE